MTGPLPDDELRSMLEERASRVSPDAGRSAMAALRATVRGASDGKGGFAVLPQALSSRGARLPWGIAALGMVAVVMVAVVGGQLNGGKPVANPTPAAPSGVPADSLPPVADDLRNPQPVELSPDRLAGIAAAGDLAGQVVIVQARIAGTNCQPAVGCDYSIVGMPEVPVVLGDDLVQTSPTAPAFDERSVLPYAVRGREDGVLELLGVVGAGLTRTLSIDQLATAVPVGGLALFDGWLVLQGADQGYVLSSTRPRPDGSFERGHATSVEVAADARPGPFPPFGNDTFLLRRTDGGWRVEGRYAASVPSVEPFPGASDVASMTADQLRAGLADGSLTGRIVVIDGTIRLMQVPCREPLACTVPTLAELGGVPIAVDPSLEPVSATQPPDGPLVFVADGVGLTYLGTAGDSLGRPVTVGELAAADATTSSTQVRLVAGSLGIPLCLGGCPLSGTGPGPASWLSDPIGTGSPATVPVAVSDPRILRSAAGTRFLVRGDAATAGWVVVAVVGERPITRVSLP